MSTDKDLASGLRPVALVPLNSVSVYYCLKNKTTLVLGCFIFYLFILSVGFN